MATLREASEPVAAHRLDVVWHDAEQRSRALASLVRDGLAVRLPDDRYVLPAT
jgi:A/G-specific adenine glycosylase